MNQFEWNEMHLNKKLISSVDATIYDCEELTTQQQQQQQSWHSFHSIQIITFVKSNGIIGFIYLSRSIFSASKGKRGAERAL